MYLYGLFDDEKQNKVSLGSIKFLSEQLDRFLDIYEKKLTIDQDVDWDTINRLKTISTLLKQQRYGELIADPSFVIDFNDDNDGDYLPEYYPL